MLDPPRRTEPGEIGNLDLRGSVWPVLTGLFAHTVAQVSASSKEPVPAVFSSAADPRELRRRAVIQRRVWPVVVIVLVPALQLPPCIGQREEDLYVQALVPQLAIKALDITVLDRPSRPNEIQVYAVRVSP